MKKITLLCALCAIMLTACKNQVGDEALLIGKWQIGKVKITGNQGAGVETSIAADRTNDNLTWEFTEKTAIYRAKDSNNTPYSQEWLYKLSRQNDNTLLIEFNGLVTGEDIGKLPICIHKLTSSKLEWERVYYGDEGPLTHYEYLKRID